MLLLDVKANKRPSGSLQGSRFLFLFLLLTFTQPSESAALRALIANGGLLGRRKRPAPVVEAEEDSGPLPEEEGVVVPFPHLRSILRVFWHQLGELYLLSLFCRVRLFFCKRQCSTPFCVASFKILLNLMCGVL